MLPLPPSLPPPLPPSYSAISRTICQSFRCDAYDDGTSEGLAYLTADKSIDCHSLRYAGLVCYAVLALLVYSIGVPVALYLRLWRWHVLLDPPRYQQDEARALVVRVRKSKRNKEMLADPLVALALPYRPHYWWCGKGGENEGGGGGPRLRAPHHQRPPPFQPKIGTRCSRWAGASR